VSKSIKVGDLVTRNGDARPWRVVGVYPDLGFARLEFAKEAWVKSATADLDQLQPANALSADDADLRR
jgi:hypothetical protein